MSVVLTSVDSSPKFGLLGVKLDHSLSPLLHTASANYLNKKISYLSYERRAEDLDLFLQDFWDDHGCGLNITFPFKELIAVKVKTRCRSVNTLVRAEQGWEGFSTDGIGFERALTRAGHKWNDFAQLVILGNGGAALALAEHAVTAGLRSLKILRRHDARDQQWRDVLVGASVDFLPFAVDVLARTIQTQPSLLVQATSAPLLGHDLHELAPALTKEFAGVFVDLTYGRVSALLRAAQALGIPSQDGLPMLIEQARAAQEIWWGGQAAPYEYLENLLRR